MARVKNLASLIYRLRRFLGMRIITIQMIATGHRLPIQSLQKPPMAAR